MADSANTTIPSSTRRAVVTGFAAVPVMALPSVASIPRGADPVLLAFDAYLAAKAAAETASAREDAALSLWEREYKPRAPGYIVMPDGKQVKTVEDIEAYFRPFDPRWKYDLRERLERILTDAGMEASRLAPLDRREVRLFHRRRIAAAKRLGTAIALRKRLREESGLDAAEAEAAERWDEMWAAEKAVLGARPTTVSGALAQLAFARKYIKEGNDAEHVVPTHDAIEAFILDRKAGLA